MSRMRMQMHPGDVKPRLLQATLMRILSLSMVILTLAFAIGPSAMHVQVASAAACDSPRQLGVKASLTQSQSWGAEPAEWIQFHVQKGQRYKLQADGAVGLEMAVYDRCDASAPSAALRNGQMEFTAEQDGEYYLLVRRDGLAAASTGGYQVNLQPAASLRPSVAAAADLPEGLLRRATDFF